MWKSWRTLMEKIMTTYQAQRKETSCHLYPPYFSRRQPYLQVNLELSLFVDLYLRVAPFHTPVSCCYVIHFLNNTNARPGLDSMLGKIFLFSKTSKQAVESTPPPTQQVKRILSPGTKRLGNKATHSRAFCADFKNEWALTLFPLHTPTTYTTNGQLHMTAKSQNPRVCR